MKYKRYFVQNSMVFITIVTYNRNPFLLYHIDLIKDSFIYAKSHFKFKIEAITLLKDHLHLILDVDNIQDYPNIIKYFKTSFSRHINLENNNITSGKKYKREKGIWQSRYWAHIILNQNDLYKHIDYIHYNSVKHYNITPKDWLYSSFKTFVNKGFYDIDWCNFEDKYKIKQLNYE